MENYSDIKENMPSTAAIPVSPQERTNSKERLEKLRELCLLCRDCPLYGTRKNLVFGEGSPSARIIFVGEGPGVDENKTGRPFVGRCGQLLRKLIIAIGLDPIKDCYIANIVKDWPPGNRVPSPEEIHACIKFLKKQIEIISPELIVLLGKTAVRGLMPGYGETGMDSLRDMSKKLGELKYGEIPVIVTYHPSALLRRNEWRDKAREDFIYIQCFIKEITAVSAL